MAQELIRDLLKLYMTKPQYVEIVKKVLDAWDRYKKSFTCLKCGYSKVNIDGPYYKCPNCGAIDVVLGMHTSRIPVHPTHLRKLVEVGVLMVTYKSSRHTHYAVLDEDAVRESLRIFDKESKRSYDKPLQVPDDLFKDIVGLDDVKKTVIRALKSKKPVHVLLVGPPASAKSMMLEEISKRIEDSYMILAGTATRVGIRDIIMEHLPHVLIIDELDKVYNANDLSVLLTWMQSQRLIVAIHGRYEEANCPYPDGCKVIAACNRLDRIPPELVSRFIVKKIRMYTPEQVIAICRNILTEYEGIKKDIAEYIAKVVVDKMMSRDPRDCVKIARLITEQTKEEVDAVVEDILKE